MSIDGILTTMLQAGAKLLLSRASQVFPHEKSYYNDPIYKYDPGLCKDIIRYLFRIRNFQDIEPLDRYFVRKPSDLKEIPIFSDGSLGLSAYSIYFLINDFGRDMLKIVKTNSKGINSSVPVSKHV